MHIESHSACSIHRAFRLILHLLSFAMCCAPPVMSIIFYILLWYFIHFTFINALYWYATLHWGIWNSYYECIDWNETYYSFSENVCLKNPIFFPSFFELFCSSLEIHWLQCNSCTFVYFFCELVCHKMIDHLRLSHYTKFILEAMFWVCVWDANVNEFI